MSIYRRMWSMYIYIYYIYTYIHTYNKYIWWNITQPLKKNEVMPFAATWMDLEIVMLSEVSQTEKEKYHMILLMWRLLKKGYKWTYLQNRNRHTHLGSLGVLCVFCFGLPMQLATSWFPDPGSNLCPRQWKLRVLTTGLPRNSFSYFRIRMATINLGA